MVRCVPIVCNERLVPLRMQGRHAFKISIKTAGGHAGRPAIDGSHAGRRTADVLRAIDAHQPPLALRSPVTDMLAAVAPHAPFHLRGLCAYARVWCGAHALLLVRLLAPAAAGSAVHGGKC
jgi:hypothetical protein